LLLGSLPNVSDNTVMLKAETYFALLQHDAGAIVAEPGGVAETTRLREENN
jgi:hypothetical protein